MVAYYENESAVDAALKAAKTAEEVHKILQDLEQRMAPSNWIQKALRVYWSMLWPPLHRPQGRRITRRRCKPGPAL